MDIEYLREFVVLSEIGNYQQAADNLFLSQTTLTRHMQSLEKELGVELFDRTSRANYLTEYGKSFLLHAHSLIDSYNSAKKDISTRVQKSKGYIAVVVPHYFRFYGISDLLFAFRQAYPDIQITISEKASHSVPEYIDAHGATFGFVTEIGTAPVRGFFKKEICSDSMILCMSSNHPLCKYDVIDPKMLTNEQFAMPQNRGPIYSGCLNACANVGFQPTVVHTVSAENIYDLVAEGMCVAFMPKKPALAHRMSGIQIRELSVPTAIHVNMIYPSIDLNESEQAFRDFALDFIERYSRDDNENGQSQ